MKIKGGSGGWIGIESAHKAVDGGRSLYGKPLA
jgi:hypothetical protein